MSQCTKSKGWKAWDWLETNGSLHCLASGQIEQTLLLLQCISKPWILDRVLDGTWARRLCKRKESATWETASAV